MCLQTAQEHGVGARGGGERWEVGVRVNVSTDNRYGLRCCPPTTKAEGNREVGELDNKYQTHSLSKTKQEL